VRGGNRAQSRTANEARLSGSYLGPRHDAQHGRL